MPSQAFPGTPIRTVLDEETLDSFHSMPTPPDDAQLLPRLCVLDFDNVVIDSEVDIAINELLPSRQALRVINKECKDMPWTQRMETVFHYIWKEGYGWEDFNDVITSIPIVDGIATLIDRLRKRDVVILVSWSNSVFIDMYLRFHRLKRKLPEVFCNPAHFDESGRLHVTPLAVKNDCSTCFYHFCKRSVINNYIEEAEMKDIHFSEVVHIAGSAYPVCEPRRLTPPHVFHNRKGYSNDVQMKRWEINYTSYPWINIIDIYQMLKILPDSPSANKKKSH